MDIVHIIGSPWMLGRAFLVLKDVEEKYMLRAIELAKKGLGHTNPNPLVGAVIVKDGMVIGEGYHEKYGELHAERNAIASLKESAEGATIYVTLEPCCHYGKTPPCTGAIIEQKIAKVVIGSRDPNPLVAGKGAKILRDAGIEVVEDYMRDECDKLNDVFFYYISTKRPYVTMKYAMTLDGKICTRTGASKWITGEKSRGYVHKMRGYNVGIMAGINTVLSDDPMLNVRGDEGARQPIRIIVDSKLRIPLDSNICKTANEYKTIIACAYKEKDEEYVTKSKALEDKGITVVCAPDDDKVDLDKLMGILGEMKIDSILLEGGGTLNYSALKAGIVNKVMAFIAPKFFGGDKAKTPVEGIGIEVPDDAFVFEYDNMQNFGEDIMIEYKVKKK